jgi:hypothetical protein
MSSFFQKIFGGFAATFFSTALTSRLDQLKITIGIFCLVSAGSKVYNIRTVTNHHDNVGWLTTVG